MKQTAFRLPNTIVFVERYIQTLQQEVLDHFIVFGEQHMDRIVAEAVPHYHEQRPHQAKESTLLVRPPDDDTEDDSEDQKFRLHCNERLGGPLKHDYLKAG